MGKAGGLGGRFGRLPLFLCNKNLRASAKNRRDKDEYSHLSSMILIGLQRVC